MPKHKKSHPKETIAEKVKLMPRGRKTQNTGTVIKILSADKLLARLPV